MMESELGDLHKHDPFKFSKLISKFVASLFLIHEHA